MNNKLKEHVAICLLSATDKDYDTIHGICIAVRMMTDEDWQLINIGRDGMYLLNMKTGEEIHKAETVEEMFKSAMDDLNG